MMKKTLFIGAMSALFFIQCDEKSDPFLIQQGMVGKLSKGIQIRQVDSIFADDSIVQLSSVRNAIGTQGEVEVYEKGGSKLLLLSPEDENDPNSLISNIQVFDNRFKTPKGLHNGSTFKDIKANYTILSIETTINDVVVSLKDNDIWITINKSHLPENLRYDLSATIEASQIPDDATFKYFMIGWDNDN
jgi:hypothetical protein